MSYGVGDKSVGGAEQSKYNVSCGGAGGRALYPRTWKGATGEAACLRGS